VCDRQRIWPSDGDDALDPWVKVKPTKNKKKNRISILRAAAVPDEDGTRLTRMTATLGYSRGHHNCFLLLQYCRTEIVPNNAAWSRRIIGRVTVVREKPWIIELSCRRFSCRSVRR